MTNSKDVVFKLILQIDIMSISWTIAFMATISEYEITYVEGLEDSC